MDRLTVFQDLLNSLPSGPRAQSSFAKTEKILRAHLKASKARILRAEEGALQDSPVYRDWARRPKIWEKAGPSGRDLMVPIVSDGQIMGAVSLRRDGKNSRPFSKDDKAFLGLVSFFLREPLGARALWARAERLNRQAALGFLSGVLAHELRNPLTALQTLLQLFPRKSGDEAFLAQFQKIMSEQVGRLQYLSENHLSWLKSGPELEAAVDLTKLAEKTLEFLRPLFKSKGAELTLLPARGAFIKAGVFQIESLLLNLIQNAFHALPPQKGKVAVSIHAPIGLRGKPGSWVELRVADNGRGIKSENLKKIFDPFFTTREEGTGLGLLICRQIVERSGGFLTAKSGKRGKTLFKALFPLVLPPS